MAEAAASDFEALIKRHIADNKVAIFSKTTCPYCKKVKALFDSLGQQYGTIELDLIPDGPAVQATLEKVSGQRTVPNVFVGGTHVGGCDATLKANDEGTLAKLLGIEAVSYEFDLVVIGGGSGGLACAKQAASHGKKVACLDFVTPTPIGTTWGLGGTCVNVGCIPKKLMHTAALHGEHLEDAKAYGWDVDKEKITHRWDAMVQGVQDHIGSLNWGYRVALRDKKVEYINGLGAFSDPHTVVATMRNGKTRTLTTASVVIAVGGRPKYPGIPGDTECCITSDDLFSLDHAPGKTLVVGASYVALECAGFLAAFGYDTTVMARSIFLRGFDQDIAERIVEYMGNHKTKFIRGAVPSKFEKIPYEDGKTRIKATWVRSNGEEESDHYDTVILAIGRYPLTQQLGLDRAGVAVDAVTGKIPADAAERTNVRHIYAIGDILLGRPELTPVAIQAGKLLADRLYAGKTTLTDYEKIPTTVFTPLEYGCIGLAEEDALKKYGEENIETYLMNFKPLEWTVAHREDNACYMKLICNKADEDRVVGLHVLAPNAGEITQGYAVGIRLGATKADFDATIGIHPTNSENFTTLSITRSSGEDATATGC
eukprot:Opistho-2@31435